MNWCWWARTASATPLHWAFITLVQRRVKQVGLLQGREFRNRQTSWTPSRLHLAPAFGGQQLVLDLSNFTSPVSSWSRDSHQSSLCRRHNWPAGGVRLYSAPKICCCSTSLHIHVIYMSTWQSVKTIMHSAPSCKLQIGTWINRNCNWYLHLVRKVQKTVFPSSSNF